MIRYTRDRLHRIYADDLCRLTAITTTMRRCYKLLLFLLLYHRRRLRYAPPVTSRRY